MRHRNKEHLKYIATLPCMICGNSSQAHHLLRAEARGMGLKTGDNWSVPLCYNHHSSLHQMGDEIGFFAMYGKEYDDVKDFATKLWGINNV